jgi:hypothetical protein
MFAKCTNTESPVVLIASNIDELTNYDLVQTLSAYLPDYILFNGAKLIEVVQLPFDNFCTVNIDNYKFTFKFINLYNI